MKAVPHGDWYADPEFRQSNTATRFVFQSWYMKTSSTLLSRTNTSTGWIFKGKNISTLFTTFQQKVLDITSSALLHMESSIHEALALSHVLLLAPQQHSRLMIDVFIKEILESLTENLVKESLELKLNVDDGICGELFRIIDSVQMGELSNDEATIQLFQLCRVVDEHTACVIAKAMGELPVHPIKNQQSISEYELTTTYFHPLLSCILSSPQKRVLLRWANAEADCSGGKKPDAILTKVTQLAYGPSLGFYFVLLNDLLVGLIIDRSVFYRNSS